MNCIKLIKTLTSKTGPTIRQGPPFDTLITASAGPVSVFRVHVAFALASPFLRCVTIQAEDGTVGVPADVTLGAFLTLVAVEARQALLTRLSIQAMKADTLGG